MPRPSICYQALFDRICEGRPVPDSVFFGRGLIRASDKLNGIVNGLVTKLKSSVEEIKSVQLRHKKLCEKWEFVRSNILLCVFLAVLYELLFYDESQNPVFGLKEVYFLFVMSINVGDLFVDMRVVAARNRLKNVFDECSIQYRAFINSLMSNFSQSHDKIPWLPRFRSIKTSNYVTFDDLMGEAHDASSTVKHRVERLMNFIIAVNPNLLLTNETVTSIIDLSGSQIVDHLVVSHKKIPEFPYFCVRAYQLNLTFLLTLFFYFGGFGSCGFLVLSLMAHTIHSIGSAGISDHLVTNGSKRLRKIKSFLQYHYQ